MHQRPGSAPQKPCSGTHHTRHGPAGNQIPAPVIPGSHVKGRLCVEGQAEKRLAKMPDSPRKESRVPRRGLAFRAQPATGRGSGVFKGPLPHFPNSQFGGLSPGNTLSSPSRPPTPLRRLPAVPRSNAFFRGLCTQVALKKSLPRPCWGRRPQSGFSSLRGGRGRGHLTPQCPSLCLTLCCVSIPGAGLRGWGPMAAPQMWVYQNPPRAGSIRTWKAQPCPQELPGYCGGI